jgi:hypothetical protein
MSADGTSLVDFKDFVLATKPHKITPTSEVLNDTAKNYYLLGDMLKGRGDEEVVQNGSEIIDMVRLSTHNAAGFYKPNQNLQPRGMDILTKIKAPWRFHQGNYAWTKEQVTLNGGGSMDNWVRLLTAWRQACHQDIWDSLENNLYAVPDNAEMEADGGTRPYSLMCFITDDGLAPAGFTTIQGVNPSTQANFRNQTESYSAAALATTIYPSFDRMWHKLNWNGPASKEEWFTSTEWRKFKILTTLNGIVQYLDTNRSNNDRLSPSNDPGTYAANPTYNGIPLKRIPAFEDYCTAAGVTQPPYDWIDARFVFPVFHSDVYMDEGDPIAGGVNQPFSYATYTNTYLNLFCRSRKRLGRIKGTA